MCLSKFCVASSSSARKPGTLTDIQGGRSHKMFQKIHLEGLWRLSVIKCSAKHSSRKQAMFDLTRSEGFNQYWFSVFRKPFSYNLCVCTSLLFTTENGRMRRSTYLCHPWKDIIYGQKIELIERFWKLICLCYRVVLTIVVCLVFRCRRRLDALPVFWEQLVLHWPFHPDDKNNGRDERDLLVLCYLVAVFLIGEEGRSELDFW